jgi:hypothetical protein
MDYPVGGSLSDCMLRICSVFFFLKKERKRKASCDLPAKNAVQTWWLDSERWRNTPYGPPARADTRSSGVAVTLFTQLTRSATQRRRGAGEREQVIEFCEAPAAALHQWHTNSFDRFSNQGGREVDQRSEAKPEVDRSDLHNLTKQ